MAAMVAQPPPPPLNPLSTASLYVGDLHPEVTEKELEEAFAGMGNGPLVSVRLFRPQSFNNSLSYAFVNFSSPSHASKALACLNNVELKGIPMRIMRYQNLDPSVTTKAGSGMANLYVKNLDPSVTSARLEGIFGKFGTILSCKVAEENGKSKGFGFVQFASKDSAISALNALHGTVFEGKTLYVSKFLSKSERKDYCVEPQFTNLYVKNLAEDLTEDALREKFSECGKVFNVAIMKDGEGKSKGFGFVNFESHEDAKKAIEALNGALIGSKKLFVGKAQKKAERVELLKRAHEKMLNLSTTEKLKAMNLYVKNLHVSIDDSKLEEIFSAFGRVTSVKVMRHNNGVSKGFGFVSFSCPQPAKKALNSLNGSVVEGRFLYVAVAQRKEERRRELQSRFAPQSFCASNWEVFPLYYNYPLLPPNPVSQSNMYPQRFHQDFYSYIPMRPPPQIPMRQSPQIPMRQSQQGGANDWVHQQHPMRYATSNVPKQGKMCWTRKVQKPSMKMESKRSGAAQVCSKGLPGRAAHATKITEILLEMEKSKIQKILDSPQYLAMQVMKAAQVKGANPCAREARAVHYHATFPH